MVSDIWKNAHSIKHRGGFPLRPPQECITIFEQTVRDHIGEFNAPYKLMLLGVTPELATLPWPQNVSLDAIDKSQEMIDLVWEENQHIKSTIHKGDWQSMPFTSNSFHCVFGDGCTTQLKDHYDYKKFL
jgi:hypothetical protein